MRIALICPYIFSQMGGIKNHVLALQHEFTKRGHRAIIFAPRSKVPENYGPRVKLIGTGINVQAVGTSATLSAALTPLATREFGGHYDLYHFHQPFAPFLPVQLLSGLKKPAVGTFHSYLEREKVPTYGDGYLALVQEIVFAKLQKLIAVSRQAASFYKRYTKRHFDIIPNGVDIVKFSPGKHPISKLRDDKLTILFVGRLDRRKGVDLLLRVWKKLQTQKKIKLVIVGDGPEKEALFKLTRQLHLRNILFAGRVSDQLLPSYYASADIFVAPATFGESFGMVLLEAMASGLPIIAFANDGYQEILHFQKKHSLAVNKDIEDFTVKLKILIDNPALRRELGDWGLAEAQKYTWDKIAGKVLEVYQSAI